MARETDDNLKEEYRRKQRESKWKYRAKQNAEKVPLTTPQKREIKNAKRNYRRKIKRDFEAEKLELERESQEMNNGTNNDGTPVKHCGII